MIVYFFIKYKYFFCRKVLIVKTKKICYINFTKGNRPQGVDLIVDDKITTLSTRQSFKGGFLMPITLMTNQINECQQ